MNRHMLVASLIAVALVGPSVSSGQTPCVTTVPGGLVAGQTWRAAGSPYCVEGDIQTTLLTIEPGVQVLVDGPYEIDVLSTITAVGTADAPIQFTARTPSTPWHGLKFQNTPAGSQLAYCTFEYSNARAISLTNTAPIQITNSTFQNNSAATNGGAIGAVGATGLVIDHCDFESNTATVAGQGGGGALWIKDGDASITYTEFDGNAANVSGYSTAIAEGGALLVDGSANVTVQRSASMGNTSHPSYSLFGTFVRIRGDVFVN